MQKSDTQHSNIETPTLLPTNKSRESLKNLDGWQSTDDHKMIYREFICHDFKSAVYVVDHIAIIAEDEKHHPDLHLTQYRNLRVSLTTHDVGGLSDKDFVVATKINALPFNKERQQLENQKPTKQVKLKTAQPKKSKAKKTSSKKVVNRVGQRIKKA